MNHACVPWDRDALFENPAFASLRPVLELCPSDRFPEACQLTELARARHIASGGGAPLRFVPGEDSRSRAFERQYEVRIYRDGEVPTRAANHHDLFNALAWLAFPGTKALLNRYHYREIAARADKAGAAGNDSGSSGTAREDVGSRGTARDVLTLFDESGAVVVCSEPELDALLRGFQWQELFWTRRAAVERAMRFFLFGHAIHEKALHPYKGLTAKALVYPVSAEFFSLSLEAQLARIDLWLTEHFARPGALDSTRVLAPLPVLGVPGWERANGHEAFYDDVSVFRPGRSKCRQ